MAYDLKVLGEDLKKVGLQEGEDLSREALNVVVDWLVASAAASPTSWDDVLVVLLPILKKHALTQIDKIDGEVDPPASS